ncbi:Histone H1 [Porphyridium purpureum]|uniref:Histone H1 n=1 Tax=Porphyridium purpureum TaxID=35688 RepID=A0A5J4Z4T4_PORPP|nr:Histone H1 [Porphyridium purpureum]|eukprot:POR7205..scf295_1
MAAKMAAPKAAAVPKPKKVGGVTKAKTVPSHPPYATMVSAAIKKIGDRTGSSQQAIAKCIGEEYKIEVNKVALSRSLKSGVDAGSLAKVKASYKVVAKEKPAPKKKTAKPKAATANGKEKKVKALKPKKTTKTKKTTKPKAKKVAKPQSD